MVWDGLIVLVIITLAIVGWNVGIVNSWRGPFAMVAATLITQRFYVDMATYIVQQLRTSPEVSIAIAYVILWCIAEIICEVLLRLILPFNKKSKPMFFERIFGALFGLFKGVVLVVLPFVVIAGPTKVPQAPPDKAALINPLESGAGQSVLFPILRAAAKPLYPAFAPVIWSGQEPSFKPTFGGDEDTTSK